jgi:hypothetical protein
LEFAAGTAKQKSEIPVISGSIYAMMHLEEVGVV